MKRTVLTITEEYEDLRIDIFLANEIPDLSRSNIQKFIIEGNLLVNGRHVKPGYRIVCNDEIIFDIPENFKPEILPEHIPLDIVYEDSHLLVVNKPKGMVVHPAAGHYSWTLVNALMYHCDSLSEINGALRPGIVHRIDKDTSGLLVCAKNDFVHNSLDVQFKERTVTRKYEAIATGTFKQLSGTVDAPIGRSSKDRKLMAVNRQNGRPAVTHYNVIAQFDKYAHIECILETGRTHQIRVHMKSIHHPLLGDEVYGGSLSRYKLKGEYLQGQSLHARVLGFVHPDTNEYMEFVSDLPDYFKQLINN
ncbi:MAG: RluA family pseudouridine synthase [Lachnospiraceae bacterium]|jgi:23S rRNA pseudouridine1911/1915/1917 synthase